METIAPQVTKEDRIKYPSQPTADKSLAVTDNKSMEISKPLDLPILPTIADEKMKRGGLSKELQFIILDLSKIYKSANKINFDNVTPEEIREIKKYTDLTSNITREDLWGIIKPYFGSVFNTPLGDKLSKMNEIKKRSEKPDYTPTMEWLNEISQRIIQGSPSLFKFNIDFGARQFDFREKPIDFLLLLIKAQKEMYPKRNLNLTEAFFAKVRLLIQSHSELIVKLRMVNKRGEDFYGSKYLVVKNSLKTLKGIMYFTFNERPLSIKQQSAMINIIDAYRKTLDMVFVVDADERAFYDKPLIRPKKDIKIALLEIYNIFDSPNLYTCETINSIFLKTPSLGINKTGISMQHLEGYIQEYFSFEKITDRYIIRQKTLGRLVGIGQDKIVMGFFNILDSYML